MDFINRGYTAVSEKKYISELANLMDEWDWDRNAHIGLTPNSLLSGSNKIAWWKCALGHEWQARIYERAQNNTGCPYCANQTVLKGFNDLATTNPDLIKEWHPIKNGSLSPYELTKGSSKKVWWICVNGHEWESPVNHRAVRGQGCPFCSGIRAIPGETDLATLNPNLIVEWHPTKNGDLSPNHLLSGSNKIAWWKCALGHEWQARIIERAQNNTGCPYCANKKVQVGFNDLATTHPELVKEWHSIKNDTISPYEITKGSSKKVWWLCSNGHEWEASVASRAGGSGCPFCSNNKILAGFNDLATTHPILVDEWDYDKNGLLYPNAVLGGSNQKVWWKCRNGHEWKASISHRAIRGQGCPCCSGRKASAGETDLATLNPKLAAEWHPTKNGNLTPNQVTVRSGKKVWWLCSYGHEWQATPNSRSTGVGCPCCSGRVPKIGVNDLATINPTLASEWHPTKNAPLSPNMVLPKSGKKVWWKCSQCEHVWQASPHTRSAGHGCPNCHRMKRKKK